MKDFLVRITHKKIKWVILKDIKDMLNDLGQCEPNFLHP